MGALLNKKGQPCGVSSLPLLFHDSEGIKLALSALYAMYPTY